MKCEDNQAHFIDLLLKVSRKLRVLFDARVKEQGLTLARARALMALKGQDDFYQKDLADELGIENATLVRLLDVLEEQGLVVRDKVDSDRRAKNITLTVEGRRSVAGIEALSRIIRSQLLKDITQENIQTTIKVLNSVAKMIEHEARL